MPFNLLQFCPSVLPFVFVVSFIPSCNFFSGYYPVSLSCMGSSSQCLSFHKIPDTVPFNCYR